MQTFKAWWNSSATAVDDHPRRVAEAAWDFAYEMQEYRIKELEKMCDGRDEIIEELQEELKESQQKHLDSIRALRKANEQITRIAADNVKLRIELGKQEEPVECEQVVYVATHNIEEDTFYVGSLREIMEWCEEWNHGVSSLNFYRLGDEVRIGFVDMGKETRFNRTLSPGDIV